MEEPQYLPLSSRRRALIGVLAVCTAVGIVLMMIYRVGSVDPPRPAPMADAARCVPGQQAQCVGGIASVIAPAAIPSAPAPRR